MQASEAAFTQPEDSYHTIIENNHQNKNPLIFILLFRRQSIRIINKINVNAIGNSHQPSSNRNASLIDTERHLEQTGFNVGYINTEAINSTGHTNSDHQQTNPADQKSQTSDTSTNTNN